MLSGCVFFDAIEKRFSLNSVLRSFTFPCGASFDELGMKKNRSDRNIVQKTVYGIIPAFSKLCPVLAYGGKRRGSISAHGKIVKAYNA